MSKIVRMDHANISRPEEIRLVDSRGIAIVFYDNSLLEAVREWLNRPKPETPEERAERCAHNWTRSYSNGFYLGTEGYDALLEAIATEIRAAEEAVRTDG